MLYLKLGISILLTIVCLLLVSCEGQLNTAYLVRHPNELKQILLHCEQMDVNSIKQNRRCLQAITAYKQLTTLTKLAVEDPEKFGQTIMIAQYRLATLQQLITASKLSSKSNTKQKIAALKQQIATMQAVSALLGE